MDIKVTNLTKKYGQQTAVDNISFEVKTGEVLGFLGPNGAGKSTTMKAITTFLEPTAGEIFVGNFSIRQHPDEVRRHIGYLPENNPLYTDMPVIDYLRFVAALQGVHSSVVNDRILEMVQTCGLEGEKHKKINELSKGYKQRVGLAQALIHNPDVLILDEPTSGLDPNQIAEIRDLIRRIGREKTVLLSSHILAEVEATCDRILIISKGKIVADGSANDLRKKATGHEIIRIAIEEAPANEVFKALQELDTVAMVDFSRDRAGYYEVQSRPGLSSRRNVFRLCADNNWYLTELTPVETKLEDVFRELTLH